MRRARLEGALLAAAAALLLVVGGLVHGQERAPAPPPGVTAWSYRSVPWSADDTEAVLRRVTGSDELVSVQSMVDSLTRTIDLRDNPQVLAAIQLRLAAKLDALGAEGWEAFWIREDAVLVAGHPLPAPTVLLKRPAPR